MPSTDIANWVTAGASLVTAAGVLLAWWQIRLTKRQATTQFEDQLNSQYREIARRLPIEALLGEPLAHGIPHDHLKGFYHYIDLTNEEVFLRRRRRLSKDTWENWREGIKWNMTRPGFSAAWQEIKTRSPESFNELRRLEQEDFASDPATWKE